MLLSSTLTHTDAVCAGDSTHRIVQIKAFALRLHICDVQVVAAHLKLVLHEHLAICNAVCVPDVLKV
jgi:hypothetical protein